MNRASLTAPIPQIDGAYDDLSDSEDENDICTPRNDSENSGINNDLRKNCARFLLTNARSLLQKTDSLNDAFDSMQLNFACVTETWFKGGKDLKSKLEEIEGASGIKYIHKSRDGRRKCTGGGVAIAFDSGTCNFKQRHMKGVLKDHEVVCAVGKLAGMRRTIAIFLVYIPPRTRAADKTLIGEGIAAETAEICSKFANPVIVIGGDFNHADFGESLNDVSNFKEVATGPTRGDNKLDLIYTNVPDDIVDARTLPPLQANNGVFSDQRCVYAECDLGQNKNFEWVVKMSRKRTKEREEAFAAPTDSYTVDAMAADLEKKIIELTSPSNVCVGEAMKIPGLPDTLDGFGKGNYGSTKKMDGPPRGGPRTPNCRTRLRTPKNYLLKNS